MDAALTSEFADLAQWQRPAGGYFFWLEFADGTDTARLREQAPKLETGFQAGTVFSSSGGFSNCLRLSFAHYSEEQIIEGIRRMRPLFG
jgi:DNA-binding transcriptional MocR family regulator